jgi:hypothetical protein
MRSKGEIEEQWNKAQDQEERGGTQWPGMTYEQGVAEALSWVLENTESKPMDD